MRDDLLESLSTERGFRHQLEGEVEELLAGGMALAVAEKEHELEASHEKKKETQAKKLTFDCMLCYGGGRGG